MKKAIAWMAENHVAANLLMLLIIIAGFVSVKSLKQEVFPEIPSDMVSIQVAYPGTSPEEIEQSILLKIEDAVSGLDGVSNVYAKAAEGIASVNVEVEYGESAKDVKDRIQAEIDRIPNFPEEAEKPVIKEVVRKSEVIQVGISGNVNEITLTKLTDKVKDDLLRDPKISQVGVSGIRNYEISIEISENSLRSYGLTFNAISNAIRRNSMDMPGGNLKTKDGEILLRTKSLGFTKEDYENIIIRSDINGNIVRIKDVAKVKDAFEDSDLITSFDGEPAALLTVYRVGDQGALEVADAVKKHIKKLRETLPAGITLVPWRDMSIILKQRLDLLYRNARWGFILVIISLSLFLNMRLAFWVASGIGISFLGSFVVMQLLGVSLNMISLFGFIIILGIVVDDAIVVGENIFTGRTSGAEPLEASVSGTIRVTVPVIFAVLTTIAAFGPLLFVHGMMGKIMKVIPVVVISVLIFSLIESLFILPAHLSRVKMEAKGRFFIFFEGLSKATDRKLKNFIEKRYLPFLVKSLKHKFLVVATGVAVLFFTFGLISSGIVRFTFMPETEGDNVFARISMPKGTPATQTKETMKKIEAYALKISDRYKKEKTSPKKKIIRHIYSVVGEQPGLKHGPVRGNTLIDPTIAEINIELPVSDNRSFSAYQFMTEWRDSCKHIAGVKSLTFSSSLMSAGNAVELKISATNQKELAAASKDIKNKLAEYDGVYDIRDDFEKGKYELRIKLKPSASTLGLTLSDLARQVRGGYFGSEALRLQRGQDEVKVMVRYPANERCSLGSVEKMMIRTPKGAEIPFTDVAEVEYGRGYSLINRLNRARVITVIANVDEDRVDANAVNSDLRKYISKNLAAKYPGLIFAQEGAQKEQKESMSSLGRGFIIALFLIYLLLAIPFKSYSQPFVVMSAIPFGFIGAVFGHLVMGYDLTMVSGMGIVALSGVVVNDSLVLVDFVNGLTRNGVPLFDAVVDAAKSRFRPIMLTSLTTFLGLMPMIFETSIQAKMVVPMAISLGFGILFATGITLILIPTGILILDSISRKVRL